MSEELQEQLVKRFTNRFTEYNEKVLYELGQIIKQFDGLIPSDAYKLAQQLKYNMTVEDLEKELAKITGKSIEEIRSVLEFVVNENIAFAKPYYEAKGLNVPIYEYHGELQRLVNSMATLSGNEFINIARSTGFKLLDINKQPLLLDLEETYNKVIDECVYAVVTGKDSYNNIMRNTIKQLAKSGVRNIEYDSGYNRRIDTAVRMNVMDTVRQIANESQKIFGSEFGSDGVEITVHENPAPDHERCQGRQFSHEEFKKFQNHEVCKDYTGNVYKIKENHKVRRAISEYNCYHAINQIILGVSKPLKSDEELQKIIDENNKGVEIDGKEYTYYEFTQLQRQLETEIRKAKEENIIAKSSNNEELILNSQQRITSLMNKYKSVSKQANMNINVDKTYVPDYKTKNVNKIIDKYKIGDFDLSNYDIDIKTSTNDVVLMPNRKKHILDKHPDIEKYISKINEIITNPDRVFLQLDKEDTIWLIKNIDDNKIKLTMKLNNINNQKEIGYKNSIISMQNIKQNRIDKYIANNKIKELFKKDKK